MSLFENLRMNTRISNMKVAHNAHIQTGFVTPAETKTIAAETQVATAKEASRKST